MIELDVSSKISVDKIAPKLDLGSFTHEQNSFAKVFETASKSFEAQKKSLDNLDNRKYENAQKTITSDKQVNAQKANQSKDKISNNKQNKKDNKNSLDNDNHKTQNKTNSNENQINDKAKKINENNNDVTSQNTDNKEVSQETKTNNNTAEEITAAGVGSLLDDIRNLGNLENIQNDENMLQNNLSEEELIALQNPESKTGNVLINMLKSFVENNNAQDVETLTDNANPKVSDVLQKTENSLSEAEAKSAKEPGFLEKLLFGKRQEIQDSKLTQQNVQESKDASEKLLNEKVQSADLTQKMIEELKNNDNKLLTQNPIQSLSVKDNIFKQNNEFLIKHNGSLNLLNLAQNNLKADAQTTLSDVMAELDVDADMQIEVTNTSLNNNQTPEKHNEFNFNSSSFTDLNSHVTKLSLNKTADFSKVMNAKTIQQDNQILNQVKEAASNNLAKGTTSVSIILRPEHLGRVHVNLVSQNGVLTAQFTAQTQQTADALNRNIETLRQNLIDQGVKIAEVSVKVQETSSSDGLLSNDSNSFEDKLGQTKEQYQSKQNHKNQNTNSLDDNNNYIHRNLNDDETEELNLSQKAENNNRNNDLGLYNNMGRTL